MIANVLANKIIYQIFPRSFKDHNNDGDGDLQGIISKLDYLASLKIDVLWLCPIYNTEFVDAGYDVLDYFQIWKQFGDLNDFQQLVQEAKKRNIAIMLDIVLNHTSNKHPWFIKALASKDNKEHNYYIWSEKANNAVSIFGGSAWEYVPSLNSCYFHLFSKEQVDLNWANSETQKAMAAVINFWYDLGVKYFRLDAIQHVCKEYVDDKLVHSFGSEMVPYLQAFLQLVKQDKDDIVFIGEASGINPQKALEHGIGVNRVADSFYNFAWWWIGWSKITGRNGYDPNWKIEEFVNEELLEYQNNSAIFPGLMINFLSNHDTARAISRWGDENLFWAESAKSLALMQFVMKGAQVIYYGEEIGMLNNFYANRQEFQDVDVANSFHLLVDQEQYYTESELLKYHNINSRDHTRYPMQWDLSVNYGFNSGHSPWIKLGKHTHKISVFEQENDSNSILNFYRSIVHLRKKSVYADLLNYGQSTVQLINENLIEITRENDQQKLVALINISKHEITDIKKFDYKEVLLTSYDDQKSFQFHLRPYESFWFVMPKELAQTENS